jgi:hypothetical protein
MKSYYKTAAAVIACFFWVLAQSASCGRRPSAGLRRSGARAGIDRTKAHRALAVVICPTG